MKKESLLAVRCSTTWLYVFADWCWADSIYQSMSYYNSCMPLLEMRLMRVVPLKTIQQTINVKDGRLKRVMEKKKSIQWPFFKIYSLFQQENCLT